MSELNKKPKDTAFRQQRLKALIPIHTAKSSAIIFLISSLVFLMFGVLLYIECKNQTEFSVQYDQICKSFNASQGSSCEFPISIPKTMPGPVYVYYELSNFYQNHRLYVKSKSYTQLRGDNPSSTELSYCVYAKYNKDFAGYYTGKSLDPEEIARPCGLIARSVFNDSITLEGYDIEPTGLVTSTDKNMYKSLNTEKEWTAMDERFITWMKISPLPSFRKLYGKIKSDVKSGNIKLVIENRYFVDKWSGGKKVVLSTVGRFGGNNTLLGIVFIVAGVFCFGCCLVFASACLFFKPKWVEQDPRSWRF